MTLRRMRIAGAVTLGLLTVAGTAQTASATSKYNECRTSGGILSIGTEYNLASQNTIWVSQASFTIERNGRPHNNVYLRVRKSDGTDVWAWTSGDNVVGGNTKTFPVRKRISRTLRPYMKGHATFDKAGNDPSCKAYITY